MISHDPSLVILSTTIVILGVFTAAVMMSNLTSMSRSEVRLKLIMGTLSLGGSIWAMHFVALLALQAPLNWAHNPLLLGLSVFTALTATAIALFVLRPDQGGNGARFPVAVATLGLGLVATEYLGLGAIAGRGLRLGWFLTIISVAFALQVAMLLLWYLYRRRGVMLTLMGSIGLGLAISATHYLVVSSTLGFEQSLAAVPNAVNSISVRYLAWSATIMMYLVCSICLCIFVIMQFRDELE